MAGGLPLPVHRDNRIKILNLQAGASDQRAVDVGDREKLGCVGGLHRAAVKNAKLRASLAAEAGRKLLSDEAMHRRHIV